MEVLLIRRRQDNAWAVPGQFEANPVPAVLSKALGFNFTDTVQEDELKERLSSELRAAPVFYTGMMGDPRNTDNAWVVAKAKWYHDDNADRIISLKELVSFQFSENCKAAVFFVLDPR
jgi:ADP-ribose pyrophosphatase YjhB (NUDIX family)